MNDSSVPPKRLSDEQQLALIRRMELQRKLIQRWLEEEIAALVPIDQDWLDGQRANFLQQQSLEDALGQRQWTPPDLELHLWRPEALRRFAEQRFGPGVEEEFLKEGSNADQVIYSMIRLRDPALAREVWLRIEEQETSFVFCRLNNKHLAQSTRAKQFLTLTYVKNTQMRCL